MQSKTMIRALFLAFFTGSLIGASFHQNEPSILQCYSNDDSPLEILRNIVENRWNDFQVDKSFVLFEPGKSEAVLKEEFQKIQRTREALWEMPGYERSEALFAADLIRTPGCAAFAFNNTTSHYNASSLFL